MTKRQLVLLSGFLGLGLAGLMAARPFAKVLGVGAIASCEPKRVFVISVGVDHPPVVPNLQLLSAELDAKRLAESVAWDYREVVKGKQGHPGSAAALRAARRAFGDTASRERVSVSLLVGRDATPSAIGSAIGFISREARPDDAVLFYFGGGSARFDVSRRLGSWTITGDTSAMPLDRHIIFLGAPDTVGAKGLPGLALLTVDQLGRWMENISARTQLVVFEAGDGREFLSDLVASLTDARPGGGNLGERERVFLGTQGVGLDKKEGGPLALALMRSGGGSLFDLNARCKGNTLPHAVASAAATTRTADSIAGSAYGRVYREREFLDIYERLQALQARSRGFGTVAPPAEPVTIGRGSLALVVGTDTYDARSWPHLNNPVNDAQTLATELRNNFGFDTLVLRNPTLREFNSALRALAKRKFEPTDELLIFVAGHGYYDELLGAGYLVFKDSRPLAEDSTLQTYLPHKMLEVYVNPIGSEHTLIVLDACFGGAFADPVSGASARGDPYAKAALGSWLRAQLQHKSRLYLTSGGKEYVSDGTAGNHSPFMRRLLEALRTASQTSQTVSFADLQVSVQRLVPEPRAGPWGSHVPGGSFVFVPKSLRGN